MNKLPAVTILFRTNGRPNYAEAAFRALLVQDYEGPIRYLIGEDTPRKAAYGKSLVELATRLGKEGAVELIWNEDPLGEAGNGQMLAARAGTDWIMVADDDDLAKPDRLRVLMEKALSLPNVWQVYSDADCIDTAGRSIDALRSDWFAHGQDTLAHLVDFGMTGSCCAGLSLYHRKVFDLAGRAPDDLMHWDISLAAAAMLGGTVLRSEKSLVQFRIHPENHRFGAPARKDLQHSKHQALLRWLKLLAARGQRDEVMASSAVRLTDLVAAKTAALANKEYP